MPKKFLEAGKIVGTHGVRGDLKVQSWCDSPEVLCDFDTLYLDEKTPVTVEKAQVHKNVVLMHIKGIDTVEAAEAMRNKVLHLDREDVELPEDLVFIQDILGARVCTEEGEEIAPPHLERDAVKRRFLLPAVGEAEVFH